MKEFLKQYWVNILIVFGSYILGIFTIYLRQRATNKALLADNAKLVKETEKIKKEHTLDIAKRKYQYESKKTQYFKYFNLIDNFSAISSEEFMRDFLPIIAKFNEELMNSNSIKEKESQAIASYSDQILRLTYKVNENLIKIKQETNTIRIIANNKILIILAKMESTYDQSLELSTEFMKAISKMIIMKDDSDVNEIRSRLDQIGKQTMELKKLLIEEVRKELNEI